MSNMCYVGIEVFFYKEEDAQKTATELRGMLSKAKEAAGPDMAHEGLDLGMGDNWLFEVDEGIRVEKHSVIMRGEVRWGMDLKHKQGICEWFFSRGASEVAVDYEEISNNLLGEWTADNDGYNEICDWYLPVDHKAWKLYHESDMCMSELEDEDYSVRYFPIKGEAVSDGRVTLLG